MMPGRVSAFELNALEDFRLCLLTKAIERGDFARLAGGFQVTNGGDGELLMQRDDFLRPDARNSKHLDEPGRHRSLEVLVILELSCRDEFRDFLPKRFADPFD